ncbi:MAG: hypothetical protein FD145_1133 [Candidatus Saganbacteria bacterium]|uniref:SPOR domain-containing protein n=1 Tax=Candidatus Saganbacteria bacterium TaxID=2575572 RepID=A0A833L0I9_UNCSA|nr:MAG: hypothetical protein FD145_1133 [Candidatus Saganbacteria bacterium]
MNWIKNVSFVLVLVLVIVVSFWISFMIGKRMLLPARKIPTNLMVTEASNLSSEISLEGAGVSFETVRPKVEPKVEVVQKLPEKIEAGDIKTGKYTIQVGAFSVYNNAKKLLEELNKIGFKARITPSENVYRVSSGKFETLNSAGAHLKKISSAGYEAIIRRDD